MPDSQYTNSSSVTSRLLLFLKGVAMGMGDSVPGVSGGTIAVITNIYDELIQSISSINVKAIGLFFVGDFRGFWQAINGNFLLTLAVGVLMGLLLSANIVLYLLDNLFEVVMAFFIGLVMASIWFLRSEVSWSDWKNRIAVLIGLGLSGAVALIQPQAAEINYTVVFFGGMIAICAMILPGLSGAFILLILGIYEFILSALIGLQLDYILIFVAGCGIGLLSFTHALAWMLRHYHELSYGFICGMLAGSVVVLWPWQQIAEAYFDSDGESHGLTSINLSPFDYLEATGKEPYLVLALISAILGALLVFLLHHLFRTQSSNQL